MNKVIIIVKFFSDEYLFHIISRDIEIRTNIIVQANTINEPEGVQSGRIKVLYHALPVSAKYEAADAVIITNSGIIK
jgi:hypothetical protein